ncbi:hypothetical protein PENTCL1PPCAC_19140, partial [Pristionchus entomophagus]
FYEQSDDGILPLMTRGFKAMKLLHSRTYDRKIQRALITLDSERKISMQLENSNADPVRIVMYGFIESSHLTFLHLIDKIDTLQSIIDGKIPKS